MELPAPINRLPYGLLDFFGLKTNGRYPRELAGTVQPTIDVWMQYAASMADEYQLATAGLTGAVNSGSVALTTVSGTTSDLAIVGGVLPVPPDEIWCLLYGATYVTFAADSSASVRGCLSVSILNGVSLALPSTFQGYDTGVAGYTRSQIASIDAPCWIRPGGSIFIQHFGHNSTATTTAFGARIRVARMLV